MRRSWASSLRISAPTWCWLGSQTLQSALVEEVVDGTPAAKAGIEPGDVITEWNGHSVADATELVLLIGRSRVGVPIRVVLLCAGKQLELEVTIEPQPEQSSTPTSDLTHVVARGRRLGCLLGFEGRGRTDRRFNPSTDVYQIRLLKRAGGRGVFVGFI